MYTAQHVDGTFAITINNTATKGMRAKSKLGILNLITTNIYAQYLIKLMGYITVTFEDGGKYVEMRIRRYEGLMYIDECYVTMVI